MDPNKVKRNKWGKVADSLTMIRAFGIHKQRAMGGEYRTTEVSYSGVRRKVQGWNKWSKG